MQRRRETTPESEPAARAEFEDIRDTSLGLAKGGREEKVLRLRFGLEDGRLHTLKEIADMFGVSPEYIRQIEAKALRKMQYPTRGVLDWTLID